MKRLGMMFLAAFMFLMVLAPSASVFAAQGTAVKTVKSGATTTKEPSSATGVQIPLVLPEGDAGILTKTIEKQTEKLTLDPQKNAGKTGTEKLFSTGKFNATFFEKATNDSRKTALKQFVENLQLSGMTEQSQQRVFDQMQAGNKEINRVLIPMVMDSSSADLYGAMRVVAPFLPFVRVVFGIGAILITLFLVGSTILDLVFIGLPIARESMSKGKDGASGGKPGFISTDAQSVINETESNVGSSGGGGYKNAYILYFKRRALTYIVLAFCLLYLVVGELGGLIAWLMSLGDGVVAAGN